MESLGYWDETIVKLGRLLAILAEPPAVRAMWALLAGA